MSASDNGRNTLRRTVMTLPNGADVNYVYSGGVHSDLHDNWASRVTSVEVDPDGAGGGSSAVTVASYAYNGAGHAPGSVVSTDYPEPDVMSIEIIGDCPDVSDLSR